MAFRPPIRRDLRDFGSPVYVLRSRSGLTPD